MQQPEHAYDQAPPAPPAPQAAPEAPAAPQAPPAPTSAEDIAASQQPLARLRQALAEHIIGQEALVERLLAALLCRGHVLLEGVPGLAKTRSLRTLARLIQGNLSRIQFTPDMLPADILGTEIFDPRTANFRTKKGPLFAHLILADEINRAPAKVQSALLEAMEERQVTLGEQSFKLPSPFFVLATQNPLEQEGTYQLPEAQLDRFLIQVLLDYPSKGEEVSILQLLDRERSEQPIEPVIALEELSLLQQRTSRIYLDAKVQRYIVDIVHATRDPSAAGLDIAPYLRCGASPRGSIALAAMGRAQALLSGRSYVSPEDVRAVAYDVLRHRLALSYEADAENVHADMLIARILAQITLD